MFIRPLRTIAGAVIASSRRCTPGRTRVADRRVGGACGGLLGASEVEEMGSLGMVQPECPRTVPPRLSEGIVVAHCQESFGSGARAAEALPAARCNCPNVAPPQRRRQGIGAGGLGSDHVDGHAVRVNCLNELCGSGS